MMVMMGFGNKKEEKDIPIGGGRFILSSNVSSELAAYNGGRGMRNNKKP